VASIDLERASGGMPGLTTNVINLISDNLRDRYRTGFSILKELVQNADDAEVRNAIFGLCDRFTTRQALIRAVVKL